MNMKTVTIGENSRLAGSKRVIAPVRRLSVHVAVQRDEICVHLNRSKRFVLDK
jgi:hypothetical protein